MGGNSGENSGKQGFGTNDNLLPGKSWKPGQCGNPAGRPKGAKTGIRARLRKLLEEKAPDAVIEKAIEDGLRVGEGATMSEVIAAKLADLAASGSAFAIKQVMSQTEKAIPAVSMNAKVEKEDLEPYIDAEPTDGDKPKASHTNTLSPNSTEIAEALDRE